MADFEEERLNNLRMYEILDTKSEPGFDQLAALAATIFDVPIALINFVDEYRVWNKANQFAEQNSDAPRDTSFCTHAIKNDSITVFEDATQDDLVKDNPAVTGPFHLRFYAAAPIKTKEGFNIGVVCIVDKKPRKFSETGLSRLEWIADLVRQKAESRLKH